LEELRFCGQGEAKYYVADGAIKIGGRLPIKSHGGQLGETCIHGMNGRRGCPSAARGLGDQVPDVGDVLVTAGTGVPTSGLILG
jgi:acetyl-CoA acetyltransferase